MNGLEYREKSCRQEMHSKRARWCMNEFLVEMELSERHIFDDAQFYMATQEFVALEDALRRSECSSHQKLMNRLYQDFFANALEAQVQLLVDKEKKQRSVLFLEEMRVRLEEKLQSGETLIRQSIKN